MRLTKRRTKEVNVDDKVCTGRLYSPQLNDKLRLKNRLGDFAQKCIVVLTFSQGRAEGVDKSPLPTARMNPRPTLPFGQ